MARSHHGRDGGPGKAGSVCWGRPGLATPCRGAAVTLGGGGGSGCVGSCLRAAGTRTAAPRGHRSPRSLLSLASRSAAEWKGGPFWLCLVLGGLGTRLCCFVSSHRDEGPTSGGGCGEPRVTSGQCLLRSGAW